MRFKKSAEIGKGEGKFMGMKDLSEVNVKVRVK
jgi:hypothetical protein